MQAEAKVCFYLGANSPTGFYSLYDQLLEPEQAETIYILKGGPGCGKSSLMRGWPRPWRRRGLRWSTSPAPATRTPWTRWCSPP